MIMPTLAMFRDIKQHVAPQQLQHTESPLLLIDEAYSVLEHRVRYLRWRLV